MTDERTEPVDLPTPELSTELWNNHADWWQDEFTDGVDPEYTEQIIPLIVQAMAGRRLARSTGRYEPFPHCAPRWLLRVDRVPSGRGGLGAPGRARGRPRSAAGAGGRRSRAGGGRRVWGPN